jgi:hypothetical protein
VVIFDKKGGLFLYDIPKQIGYMDILTEGYETGQRGKAADFARDGEKSKI